MTVALSTYHWHAGESYAHSYLLPVVEKILPRLGSPCRVFDLGCGNGRLAAWLTERGYEVTGVDPSTEGVAIARDLVPSASFDLGSSDDDLSSIYGTFPLVTSLEVVEHVYSAQTYGRRISELLVPGGIAIISTPYHGYLKNLALALAGKFDWHFHAEQDGGHIKFWSPRTLTSLLASHGLQVVEVHRVGRIAPLAKSMVVVARKTH